MDKISIVVPVYNAVRYLEETINSILGQTYENWELLLIDDCSKDDSAKICYKFQKNDVRIRFLRNEQNIGSAATRNKGIKCASGKYIAFVDSDDTIEPNYLECLYQVIIKYHADVVWCNYKECFPDGTNQIRKHNLPTHEVLKTNDLLKLYYSNKSDGLGSMCNKLYRLDFLRMNNLLLDERMAIGEDWNFNLDAFQKLTSLVAIDNCLYNYARQNQSSIMNSFHENHFELMCEMRNKLLRVADENNVAYNKNIFWLNFLYNTLVFLHKATKKGKGKDYMVNICNHELFKISLKNVKKTHSIGPFYNLILLMIRLRLFSLAFLTLSKR